MVEHAHKPGIYLRWKTTSKEQWVGEGQIFFKLYENKLI